MSAKKINLLYIIYSLNNGGAETLAIRLAELLDKNRFNATVCSLSDSGPLRDLLVEKNIPFVTLAKKEGKDFPLVVRLHRLLKQRNIDLIHTHNQGPLLYTVLATLWGRRYKIVHTEHINMIKEFSYSKKNLIYNGFLYRRLAGFLSIAKHLTDDFSNHYNLEGARVITIHNSVEMASEVESPEVSLRSELGIDDTTALIGNISALRQQKDHATLIEAMRIVVSQKPDTVLVIAGDGELREDLQTRVVKHELSENVLFLGYRSDVDQLLAQFDLFVLSSLYEGLPLCILEAMATGCPVVATDADGTNELVRDRQTGLLVPLKNPQKLAEAILEVLSDPEEAVTMGERGQKLIADQYNMKSMIGRYEEYYQDLCHSSD